MLWFQPPSIYVFKISQTQSLVKVRMLMDLKGSIPSFIPITDDKVHDVNILNELICDIMNIFKRNRFVLVFQI